MKKIALLCSLLCIVVNVNAGVIPVTKHYTGEVHSYFQRGTDIYSLEGTTTDGYVEEYSYDYPYAGGTVLNQQSVALSSTSLGILTIFTDNYITGTDHPKCWARGNVRGTITIGTTSQYQTGTPLILQINYFSSIYGGLTENQCSRIAGLASMDEEVLWQTTQLTYQKTYYHIPVAAGTSYIFGLVETIGSQYMPVEPEYASSEYLIQAVAIDFSVIVPEPATVVLLGLGGLLIRKR